MLRSGMRERGYDFMLQVRLSLRMHCPAPASAFQQTMSIVQTRVSVAITQMELDSVPVASFWLDTVADKATAQWESRADAHDTMQRTQPQLAHLVPQFWIMGTARLAHAELINRGEKWVLHPSEFNGNSLYNVRNEEFIKFIYVRQFRIACGIPLIEVFLRAIVASVFMCRVLQRCFL